MKLFYGLLALFAVLIVMSEGSKPASAQLSMLHTSGLNIVNASGTTVQLRGVNLGDWLVMEPWMCPAVSDSDANGSYQDEHSILAELDSRFGVAEEQSLISTYQNAYITTADLANIKAQGLNLIRVPVWWGDFYTLGTGTGGTGTWRSDAFTQLDNIISEAAADGIYTIIDMHGAIGQQSDNHSTGWQNENNYWGSTADQAATNTMWQNIATHYNGNPNVAAYDILNEPDNAPSDSAVIAAYVSIMQAIRAVDSNHICCIEGTFDAWDWSMLPSPSSEGWTNVVYEMHQYNGSGSGDLSAAQGQITDWDNHASWDTPDYIGEFNPGTSSTDSNTGLTYWQDVVNLYSSNGVAWSVWTYKAGGGATEGSGNWNDNWGLYQPNQSVSVPTTMIPTPAIATSSSATIQSDWAALTTANYFVLNTNVSSAVVGGNPPAPAAPTDLTATPGNAQVSLSWSGSAGGASYNVYRGTTSGGESSTAITTGLTGTTYTDTAVVNGTTYYYKVAAVNASGTSPLSTEASAKPVAPVEAPYGGTAAAIPGTVYADAYDTGGANLGYSVTSTNGSDNGWRTTGDGVDLETCSDTTTNGADMGWTATGQWFRYTVNVATPGVYTVGFRVSSGASGGTLNLQNAAGTNLTGVVTVPGTGGWQTWTTVDATATLPAGQQVLTVYQDSGGWNINYVTFTSGASAPPAPTGLTATAGNTQVALSWTATTGAASYSVYRGTSSGGESSTAIATGITASTYTDASVTNGTTYYYKVAAVNSVGTSSMSNEASATPSGPVEGPYGGTAAGIPGTVYADAYDTGGANLGYSVTSTNGSDNGWRTTGDGVDLETCSDTTTNGADMGWTAAGQWFRYTVDVATAGTYTVGFRVASDSSGGTLNLENASGTNLSGTVTVPGTGGWQTWTTVDATVTLPAGTQVLTVEQDSGGWNINYVTFTSTTPTAPSAPTGLAATAGNAQVALSWTASSGATSYNVYRGTTSGSESSTAIATGLTGTTYTNTGLTNGTAYYYKVAAVNSVGTSALSAEAGATPSASSGPIANGTYDLTPQNATGSRVDATGGGTSNGTAVQIWQYTAGDVNQHWVFTNEGGSVYMIQPAYDTALAIEVSGGGSSNGTAVVLWASNGSSAQRWAATSATSGYTFTPQCATATTLNVSGPSSSNGALLQIWQATGGTNTVFALTAAD